MKKSLRSFPASIQNARSLRKNATASERILWDSLRGRRLNGWKFRRQHPIGQFVVDFFCRKKCVAVELDGEVHTQIEVADHDAVRDKFLRLQGVKILRFPNNRVLEDLQRVLEEISKIMGE